MKKMLHSNEEILKLCQRINMPSEMTAKIADELEHFDFTHAASFLPELIVPATGSYALACITGALDGYGLRILIACLSAAIDSEREIYAKKGISDKIYTDTMSVFTVMVNEYHAIHGVYGFDSMRWIWRQLSGSLYRLGTLEFEMIRYQGDDSTGRLEKNTPLLSVHIPSNAILSREEIDKSYAHAREFFANTEYANAPFYCWSWLLSPKLREMLPESSGIRRFMDDFEIINEYPDGDSANIRVFKTLFHTPENLPEDTSLQRNLKELLLKGGHAGDGEGFISNLLQI